MASARAKAEQAQQAATKAQSDAEKGRQKAYSYDPNFVQPGIRAWAEIDTFLLGIFRSWHSATHPDLSDRDGDWRDSTEAAYRHLCPSYRTMQHSQLTSRYSDYKRGFDFVHVIIMQSMVCSI